LIAILAYASLNFSGTQSEAEKPEATEVTVVSDSLTDTTPVPRVADLGRVMYTRYLWAIELAGAILLVATLGAIQIAREELTPNLQSESPSP
jgi:NADH:ubiquinone oxidoreductase subunit 6 (subunit J)